MAVVELGGDSGNDDVRAVRALQPCVEWVHVARVRANQGLCLI